MRVLFLLCALFVSVAAHAGPITASHSGCVSSLPDGASWIGEDFLFMAFHDPEAGCEPTIRNNTRGLHIESTSLDGQFRVDMPPHLLRGLCGRVQIDAHVRVPGGLSTAPEGLHTLVYNTGVSCYASTFTQPRPPEGLVTTVPDSSSTLLLWGLALVAVWLKDRVA